MSFLLKALNLLDAAMAGRSARLVADNVAYGAAPRQKLDIQVPRSGGANRPVLVFFYGGNWDSGEKQDYAFVGRTFAGLGHVTVIPDYTHSSDRPYPVFMEDAAAALAWIATHINEYGGDPARIVVAGHSAGAYIAATLALDPRWGATGLVRAAIGLAGPYDFLPFDSPVTERTFGHAADLAATQPVNHVSASAPPFLLITGDADTTVRARHSTEFAARLHAASSDAELILYPGITHTGPLKALARPFRGHAPVLQDIAGFLDRHGLR
jgi:acetyl esterase/lipase